MNKLYSLFNKIKLVGVAISGLALVLMMFAIVADVLSRNITGASILGVYEMTQNYLMILTIFPALPYVYAQGIMPKMELLFDKFKGIGKTLLVLGIQLVEMIVYLLIFYYSLQYALTGLENDVGFMAGGNIYTLYPVLFLIPISFALMFVETVFVFVKNMKNKTTDFTYEVREEETYY